MFDYSAIHVGHVVFLIYAVLAGSVVVQLSRRGKRAFDDAFTDRDRALVGAATFYLGLPLVLVAYELIQLLVLWRFGAHTDDLLAWLSVGTLPAKLSLSSMQIVALTLSGNLLAFAIGVAAIASTVRYPINAAWNFARLELGRVTLGVILVIHPLVSVVLNQGSFQLLRHTLNAALPFAGDVSVGLYAVLAISAVRFSQHRRFQRWYVELATPLFHAISGARRRAELEPHNAQALRDLGGAYLAATRFDLAQEPLTRSVALDASDARTQFLLGMLRLKQDNLLAAEAAFCAAGQLVEAEETSIADRRGLELEITLALAGTRLRLKDAAGAVATAEAALQIARRDSRALIIYSDALVAAGRAHEAHAPLELALKDARGSAELEIRRRIEALERGR